MSGLYPTLAGDQSEAAAGPIRGAPAPFATAVVRVSRSLLPPAREEWQ